MKNIIFIHHAFAQGIRGDANYKQGRFQAAADHYHEALKAYERHYRSDTGPESIELVGATQLVAWNLLNQVRLPLPLPLSSLVSRASSSHSPFLLILSLLPFSPSLSLSPSPLLSRTLSLCRFIGGV